mmetsp:Transcript_17385/g.24552  ORF Transcript_17385/g.24552 Transcript_17385/m.24552 type:complete len:288 (+) Transcript_17385:996-1859(+)
MTLSGDCLQYNGDAASPATNIIETKILINSVLSTPNAKFASINIKNFFLNTPMVSFEYVAVPISRVPQQIMDHYKLHHLIHNSRIYCEVRKGMYGLKQATQIAYDLLLTRSQTAGYYSCQFTAELFRHESRPIAFTLCIDDFGIKYTNQADIDHLIATLRSNYEITIDWKGRHYCDLTLEWNYNNRYCDVHMLEYIPAMLSKFNYVPPYRKQHAPLPMDAATIWEEITTSKRKNCLLFYQSLKLFAPYNQKLVPFCSMPEPLITPSYQLSTSWDKHKLAQLLKPFRI